MGHVLYLYMNRSHRSIANVEKELAHKYRISTQEYTVTKVISTSQKMKKLNSDGQFSLSRGFVKVLLKF